MARMHDSLSETLAILYVKTSGGERPFPPQDIHGIDALTDGGHVRVRFCCKDSASTHGAKTCKVQLGWMTESSKKQASEVIKDDLENRISELKSSIDAMNPQMAELVRFLLERWAMRYASPSMSEIYSRVKYFEWANTEGLWDIRLIRRYRGHVSLLPEKAKQETKKFILQMQQLGLAAWARPGHNTKGWFEESVLVTAPEAAAAIVKKFWGSEIPWPLNSMIDGLFRTQIEASLGHTLELESRLFIERDLHEFLTATGYRQLYDYLYAIHSLEFAQHHMEPVDWGLVRKYVNSPRWIDYDEKDKYGDRLPVRSYIGGDRPYRAISEYKLDAMILKVRKAFEEWLENGTIHIEPDIPSRRELREGYSFFTPNEEVRKKLSAYIESVRKELSASKIY